MAHQEVEALADRGEGIIRGSTSFEHLWTRTCDSVFGAPKNVLSQQRKTRSKSGPSQITIHTFVTAMHKHK